MASNEHITREQALAALQVVNEYEGRLAAMRVHLLNIVAEFHKSYEAVLINMMADFRGALDAPAPQGAPANDDTQPTLQ